MGFTQVALILAALGTLIQAVTRLVAISDNEVEMARHFSAVRDLIEEVKWPQVIRRFRRSREVMAILRDHPQELRDYRRLYWELVSWSLLVTASGCALIGSFVN